MIVDISLDCVGSERPLWGTLVRLPRPLSLMFPYSRRVMAVLRRSLYGVVSDGRVLGLFVPLPPAVLTGFPQGAQISLDCVESQRPQWRTLVRLPRPLSLNFPYS